MTGKNKRQRELYGALESFIEALGYTIKVVTKIEVEPLWITVSVKEPEGGRSTYQHKYMPVLAYPVEQVEENNAANLLLGLGYTLTYPKGTVAA